MHFVLIDRIKIDFWIRDSHRRSSWMYVDDSWKVIENSANASANFNFVSDAQDSVTQIIKD